MKTKKLLSLILLGILCSIGNVWGESKTYTFDDGVALSTDWDVTTDVPSGGTAVCEITNSLSGASFSPKTEGSKYLGLAYKNKSNIGITITSKASYDNITQISIDAVSGDNSKPTFAAYIVTASGDVEVFAAVGTKEGFSTGGTNNWGNKTISISPSVSGKLKIVTTASSSGKYAALDNIVITYTSSSTPSISASDASISATESGVEVTQDIAVTGSNLAGSTLTATLSPAVEGLSVTLGSSTITTGSISTTATLHYTQTVNASGNTTLTFSDGTTTKDVTITYNATVAEWTLQSISEETTWDFSTKVTGSKQYSGDDLSVEHVYANITELEFADAFNATAIAFTGEYPFRSNDKKFAQNGTIHIRPTVPGTLSVKFSDTGSKNPTGERYLNINDVNSQYYTQRDGSSNDTKTVSGLPVDAGDVEIKACYADGSAIAVCVYTLTFTPITEYSIDLTAGKWASFCPSIDVTIPANNVVAYKGVVSGSEVVLTPIGQNTIKAGVGVILKASTTDSYTFSSTTAAAFADNALLGTTMRKARNTTKVTYALSTEGGVQKFVKYEGDYIPANKAYFELESAVTLAPSAFRIVDGEENATNIEDFKAKETVVKFFENGQLYIQKNGVVYDTTGRIIK